MTRRAHHSRHAAAHELRIIGGEWKRRKVRFFPVKGLRPTPDRVRETLFNWLQGRIYGRRCLDLFSGSGALGFEAVSRGAREAVLIEPNHLAAIALRDNAQHLKAETIQVEECRAEDFLQGAPKPFDLVFLDPPFGEDRLEPTMKALMDGWLTPEAYVYVESDKPLEEMILSRNLSLWRQGRAGQVNFFLFKVTGRSEKMENGLSTGGAFE